MQKKVIISHPTGNENLRNAVLALSESEMLNRFYTTVGIFSDNSLFKVDIGIIKDIKRRTYDNSLKGYTKFHPYKELGRLMSQKLKVNKFLVHEKGFFSAYEVYKNLDRFVAKELNKRNASILYAYSDGALNSFHKAKELGMMNIYDMSSCYYKKVESICELEKEKNPEWSATISILKESFSKKLNNDSELLLADNILVASTFCKESLSCFLGDLNPISIIPYGFPPVNETGYNSATDNKLKVLFVGKLSQQKGISYLFDAVNEFRSFINLTIIGSKSNTKCKILDENLLKHNYLGTLSHNQVLQEMKKADVLLFPTLSDAFGMVITEAMSQGTPVITTSSSVGPEFIRHKENGWIVDPGDSEAIKIILEEILIKNICKDLGRCAQEKAKTRPWSVYRDEIIQHLSQF